MKARGWLALALLATALAGEAGAAPRDRPRIVGPAEFLPYAEAAATRYAATTGAPRPVVESAPETTAIRLFCGGIGPGFPDLATSTRDPTERERRDCATNGVADIAAIPIGTAGVPVEPTTVFLLLKTPGRDSAAGLAAFGRDLVSEEAIGPGGSLAALGLVPLPDAAREAARRLVAHKLGPDS